MRVRVLGENACFCALKKVGKQKDDLSHTCVSIIHPPMVISVGCVPSPPAFSRLMCRSSQACLLALFFFFPLNTNTILLAWNSYKELMNLRILWKTLILLYRCIFFLLTIDLISLLETVHLDPLFPHPHSIDLHFTIYYLFTCGSSLIFVFWLWYINIQPIFQLFTLKS